MSYAVHGKKYRRQLIVNLQSENQDTNQLAKYECSKMNLSQNVTIGQIESEIEMIQNQLDNKIEEYENAVRKLDEYVRVLNRDKSKIDDFSIHIEQMFKFSTYSCSFLI